MEEALHYIPLTLFTLLTLLSVDTIDTAYTIQIALHCLNSSMHASLGNVRKLLEWADGLLSNDEDGYVGNDVVEKDVFFDCVTPALTAYLGASPKKLLEPGRQR